MCHGPKMLLENLKFKVIQSKSDSNPQDIDAIYIETASTLDTTKDTPSQNGMKVGFLSKKKLEWHSQFLTGVCCQMLS